MAGNLIYTPDDDITWPEKTDKRLPDHQRMMPMWDDNASYWERVKRMGKRREYMFERDWIVYVPCLEAWCIIRANFVHDWSSIPRALTLITDHDGILAPGAPLHDHGYRFGGVYLAEEERAPFFFTKMTRNELDKMFRDQNTWYNGLPVFNQSAYLALRAGGWANFKPRPIAYEDWSKPVYSNTGM